MTAHVQASEQGHELPIYRPGGRICSCLINIYHIFVKAGRNALKTGRMQCPFINKLGRAYASNTRYDNIY